MSQRRAYTFRSTELMDDVMEDIMKQWEIDRTSVIKLALYKLATYMADDKVRGMSRHELVAALEARKPADFPPFGAFADH